MGYRCKKIAPAFFALMIGAGAAFADTATVRAPSPLLDLVRKNYTPNTWLSTKFSLTIYWSVREKEEKKEGSIALAPGNRFRVVAGSETYVSNGETLWDYNAKANQVAINRLAEVDKSMLPSQLFASYVATCPFREKERKGGLAVLTCKNDSATATIDAWVNANTGAIVKCVMTDRNDNLFTYTFAKTTFGKKNSKEAFEFAIPTTARVIDMRK
jgi:outer membrane lipoprotein-sorting protein